MIPERIIKLAIEGGWRPYSKNHIAEINLDFMLNNDMDRPSDKEIICDPLFWQALAKAKGWKIIVHSDLIGDETVEWQIYAHQFFDLLLTNGNTSLFWDNIHPHEDK